jgi:hypothetical protein
VDKPREEFRLLVSLAMACLVTGCGGSNTPTYSVGGTISGLSGAGLVLDDNAVDQLPVAAGGNFSFAKQLPNGSTYSVTIDTQPANPAQTCALTGGSGTVMNANVSNVVIDCRFHIADGAGN